MRRSTVSAGVVLALSASVPALARDTGGWTVTVSDDGAGCFLTRQYDRAGDTTLLLGLDADGTNRLTVLNGNWSIAPRDGLRLTFRLTGSTYARQLAVGIASDGKRGFVTSFDAKFPTAFAKSLMLEITRGDVAVERLSLAGSGAAVADLRTCVEAQRAKPVASASDKRRSDDIPKDPFAPAAAKRSRR